MPQSSYKYNLEIENKIQSDLSKKTCISVIELDYHSEVLRSTCRILEDSNLKVNVFTTTLIWEQTKLFTDKLPENFTIYTVDRRKQSVKNFVKENFEILNSSDIIFFNTIASNFKLFSDLNFSGKTISRVHNSNTFFNNSIKVYKPKFSIFYLFKDLSHFIFNSILKLDWYYRNKLLKKIDYFAFPSLKIESYAAKQFKAVENNHLNLPFAFTTSVRETKTNHSETNIITISILGKIDKRNRDYILIVSAINYLVKNIKPESYILELVLLGNSDSMFGRAIIKKLKDLECRNFSLISFKKFVPQDRFLDYVTKTNFFVLPINDITRHTIYEERYGYTKLSGSINDLINYRKPALISASFPLSKNLMKITNSFTDSVDLAQKINFWSLEKKFNQIDVNQSLKIYQLSELKKNYIQIFDKVLKESTTK